MRDKGLRRCDADFRPRMEIDHPVAFERHRAAHDVRDRHDSGFAPAGLTDRRQRGCRGTELHRRAAAFRPPVRGLDPVREKHEAKSHRGLVKSRHLRGCAPCSWGAGRRRTVPAEPASPLASRARALSRSCRWNHSRNVRDGTASPSDGCAARRCSRPRGT